MQEGVIAMELIMALKLSEINRAIRKQRNGTVMVFGPSGDVEIFYPNAGHYAKKPLSALKDYADWIPMVVNLGESKEYNFINMGYRMSEITDVANYQLTEAEGMFESMKDLGNCLRMMCRTYEKLVKEIKD